MNNNFLRKAIFSIRGFLIRTADREMSRNMIAKAIVGGNPLMVARFGAVEIKAVLYGIYPPPFNVCLKKYVYAHAGNNAGFFPVDDTHLERFARLMMETMKQVDLLASWRPEELFFKRQLWQCRRVDFDAISPFDGGDACWGRALRSKRVLVIHPFAETIERQYHENRTKIWNSPDVLPEFASLQTIKAVQSIAGNQTNFSTWFDALEWMKSEIDKRDFDVALLGCGAYGFPLAAYIKQCGKQAIHIGGTLQLYFGIKGKRWDDAGLYKDAWVSPSANERPKNLGCVEEGCYW